MQISAIPKRGKIALIIGVLGIYQKRTDKLAIWEKLELILTIIDRVCWCLQVFAGVTKHGLILNCYNVQQWKT